MIYMKKLLIKILDYDWLKDNRKFSEPMMSPKMMTKILKKNCEKVSQMRQNGCIKTRKVTLATDDTIEDL